MISAKIVLDSVSTSGDRLTTMVLTYPRFIHSELMTHRQWSRNAASSRAIPIQKMIEAVERNPAMPVRFGLNGAGMQDHGEMTPFGEKRAIDLWLRARDAAVEYAKGMVDSPEPPHKQIVNRILEPFAHMTTIVSATNWDNFFALRDHSMADPTFGALAATVRDAYNRSTPSERADGDWHLPFVEDEDIDDAIKYVTHNQPPGAVDLSVMEAGVLAVCLATSTARCARVSYLNHEGRRSGIEEDLRMFDRLVGSAPVHASPAEHQAASDPAGHRRELHGNFTGWVQHRKLLPNESVVQRKYAHG